MDDQSRQEQTWAAAFARLEPALLRLADRLAVLEVRLADVGELVSGVRTQDAMQVLRDEMRATLTGASEALREVVQVNLEDALAAIRVEVERAMSAGREEAAAPVERLRESVESEIQRLREQVAYGMSALVRQLDALRRTPSPAPNAGATASPPSPPSSPSPPSPPRT